MKLTQIAHQLWLKKLQPGDFAIDATCGNGFDSLFLAQHILTATAGKLTVMDIQPQAISATKMLIESHIDKLLLPRIQYIEGSHEILPLETVSPKFICYNLGYLPGSNKEVETITNSTLASVNQAVELVRPGGLVSILSYIGHSEGKKEYQQITSWLSSLPRSLFDIVKITKPSSLQAPVLLLIEKLSNRTNEIKTTSD